MNVWLIATAALLCGLVPCLIAVLRGSLLDRFVALQLATTIVVLALLCFEQGEERQSFFDVSFALAVLAFPSAFIYARVFERWL